MQEKLERLSGSQINKASRVASVAAVALGLSSFSVISSAKTSKEPSAKAATYLTPTLKGGVCSGGPCTMNILSTPFIKNLAGPLIINLPDNHLLTHWYWPQRAAYGKPGNPVAVDCYINYGSSISTNWNGKPLSSDWYEVIVPMQHVISNKVKRELSQPNSPIKTVSFDGKQAVLGWASVEYFGNEATVPVKKVPECN